MYGLTDEEITAIREGRFDGFTPPTANVLPAGSNAMLRTPPTSCNRNDANKELASNSRVALPFTTSHSRTIPSVPDSIEAIHDAGGVAIWAHPFWTIPERDAVLAMVDDLHARGIDGVECFYITHTREQAEVLLDRCDELGMLITGSSDFHGPGHREFSQFRAFSTYGREPRLGPIAG